jgi:hypothetical protein
MAENTTETVERDDSGLPTNMDMFDAPPAAIKEPDPEPEKEPEVEPEVDAEPAKEPEKSGFDKGLQNQQIKVAELERRLEGGLSEIKEMLAGLSNKTTEEKKDVVADVETSFAELFDADALDEMPTNKSMIKLMKAANQGKLTTTQAKSLVAEAVKAEVKSLRDEMKQDQKASAAQRENDRAMEQLRTDNPDVDIDAAAKEYQAKVKYMVSPDTLTGADKLDLEREQSAIWQKAMDNHRTAVEPEADPEPPKKDTKKSAKGADIKKSGTKAAIPAPEGTKEGYDQNGLPLSMLE